jgi:hypothetical protein
LNVEYQPYDWLSSLFDLEIEEVAVEVAAVRQAIQDNREAAVALARTRKRRSETNDEALYL